MLLYLHVQPSTLTLHCCLVGLLLLSLSLLCDLDDFPGPLNLLLESHSRDDEQFGVDGDDHQRGDEEREGRAVDGVRGVL